MQYRSIALFSEREWAVMTEVTDRTLEIALFLLPLFFLIRITHDYTRTAMGEHTSTLFAALYEAIALLCLLIFYKPLLEAADALVLGIICALQSPWTLLGTLKSLLRAIDAPISSFIKLLQRSHYFCTLLFVRGFLIYLRGYLAIFSTAVGPLALAVSLLPGPWKGAASTWMAIHFSFLAWGITMTLLDLFLSIVGYNRLYDIDDWVRDWFAAQAFSAMYLLVIPLTSLYLGQVMRTGLSTTTSLVMGGSLLRAMPQWLTRIGKAITKH